MTAGGVAISIKHARKKTDSKEFLVIFFGGVRRQWGKLKERVVNPSKVRGRSLAISDAGTGREIKINEN